jgi:hypothetical protein
MQATSNRAHRNQSQAKQMYGDAAKDIAAQMPEITNQMAQASQETQNRYDSTQQALQGEYNQQAAAQAALYKKLGIQAAAPEASQQAMDDQAYFQQQSKSDESNALQLLSQMKNADVSYNRQSADNTRLAGINTAQDIGNQLEDYLLQANDKMAGLQSGRQSSIGAALAQLQQADAQRVDQQNNTKFQQMMGLANLQLQMQQMEAQNNKPLFQGTNGQSGMSNYLAGVYPGDTTSQNSVANLVNQAMQDPTVIAGQYDSGRKDAYNQPIMTKVNDAYLEHILRQIVAQQDPISGTQYDNADINNAINAILAKEGKLK